jgi:uroporphyrinogen decarboxylase
VTSRERVRRVLNGELPDRVPNGLGACETAGLHLLAYDTLQDVLGIRRTPPRLDTFMTNAVFEKEMIRAIEGDMILLASPNMCGSRLWGRGCEREWKEQRLWGRTFRISVREQFTERPDGSVSWDTTGTLCPPGGIYFDSVPSDDFSLHYEVPSPDAYRPHRELPQEMLRSLEETAKELYETTDLALCCGETITDLQVSPAGFVGTMMLMKQEPRIMHEFLGKACEAALSQVKMLDQAIGTYVDVCSIAHDLGDNRGVTMGAGLWREIYKPHYLRLFQEWKKITRMKINLHSCGSIVSILPDLVECGLDIFNPVQTSAAGMDARALSERFGSALVFYGGAYDAQRIDRGADYQGVFDAVKADIETFKAAGRYIFAGVHNLPGDLPRTHLAAMIDAWKSARDYAPMR